MPGLDKCLQASAQELSGTLEGTPLTQPLGSLFLDVYSVAKTSSGIICSREEEEEAKYRFQSNTEQILALPSLWVVFPDLSFLICEMKMINCVYKVVRR